MARRRQTGGDDEGGGANWMDTYGDLVTLLLCFFVLLFAFSSLDAKQWEALVGAFSGTNVMVVPNLDPMAIKEKPIQTIPRTAEQITEPTPSDLSQALEEHEALEQLYRNMSEYVEANQLPVDVFIDYDSFQVVMRFGESILFDSGEAVIKEEALPILDSIILGISNSIDLIKIIDIQGHTDNVPISTQQFPDNWALANERAWKVLRYVHDLKIFEPVKLSCHGFGEWHPVADNNTPEGRASNRRVDFVLQAYYSNVFADYFR